MLLDTWIHLSLLVGHTLLVAHSTYYSLNYPYTDFLFSSVHYGASRAPLTVYLHPCSLHNLAGALGQGVIFCVFLPLLLTTPIFYIDPN